MKVVKTQKTWNLNKRGYPVAIRFQSHVLPKSYHEITHWLKENRGKASLFYWHDEKDEYRWTEYTGKSKSWKEPRPYFIGLKEEADLSILLMSIGHLL